MTRKSALRSTLLVGALSVLTVSTVQAQGAGPYNFFSVTPCRIVDTRATGGKTGLFGPPALVSGSTRHFPIVGQCGIPTTAKAAVLNVTFVGPTSAGHITIVPYPMPTPFPTVSTVNAAAGEPAIANGAIVPLASDPTLQISVVYVTPPLTPMPKTNLVIDVTGYFQ
jgi:hypothetical protein